MSERTKQVEQGKVQRQRLRALFGLFEGDPEDIVFVGACSEVTWECATEEDWERLTGRWKEEAPVGTGDWRECWLDVEVPLAPFAAPTLPSKVEVPDV